MKRLTRPRTDRRLADLIAQVAEGDRIAFARLYDATAPRLFGLVLRLVQGDRDAAEDVLEQTYLRLWRGASQHRLSGAPATAWLLTIARDTALDRLRRRGGTRPVVPEPALQPPPPEELPETVDQAERGTVLRAVGNLPPERAAALRAVWVDGVTLDDIADRAGVPVDVVRTWLRRSILHLRLELGR